MNKKVLYFDVETTGLDCKKHALIQLAGLIEIGGVVKDEFNIFIAPHEGAAISDEALEVHGYTREDLNGFRPLREAHSLFISKLSTYVDRYDREDKFYVGGYNVGFDLDFLSEFFKRVGDKYLGSWINWRKIDPLPILYWADYMGLIDLGSYKLEAVCKKYGITIDAHDALSDVRATRLVLMKLNKALEALVDMRKLQREGSEGKSLEKIEKKVDRMIESYLVGQKNLFKI